MQNIILFDLSGDFVKCILKEARNYFLQFWLHIFCTLFKTCRQFAQQNKNARQFLSNQRAFAVSEWRDSNSRPPAPKAGALPTAQHPGVWRHRQNIVYRFLRGSSIQNPQLTALHGLLFFSRQNRQLATAKKGTAAGTFYGNWAWLWRNCQKENAKNR